MKSINVADLVKKQKQQYTPATPPKTDLSSCAVYAQFVQYASTDVGLLSTYLQDTAVETSEMSEDTASSSLSRVTSSSTVKATQTDESFVLATCWKPSGQASSQQRLH